MGESPQLALCYQPSEAWVPGRYHAQKLDRSKRVLSLNLLSQSGEGQQKIWASEKERSPSRAPRPHPRAKAKPPIAMARPLCSLPGL